MKVDHAAQELEPHAAKLVQGEGLGLVVPAQVPAAAGDECDIPGEEDEVTSTKQRSRDSVSRKRKPNSDADEVTKSEESISRKQTKCQCSQSLDKGFDQQLQIFKERVVCGTYCKWLSPDRQKETLETQILKE